MRIYTEDCRTFFGFDGCWISNGHWMLRYRAISDHITLPAKIQRRVDKARPFALRNDEEVDVRQADVLPSCVSEYLLKTAKPAELLDVGLIDGARSYRVVKVEDRLPRLVADYYSAILQLPETTLHHVVDPVYSADPGMYVLLAEEAVEPALEAVLGLLMPVRCSFTSGFLPALEPIREFLQLEVER